VETLKAVSDIEALGAGSNAAWALCERIRKGEAGRTEAREKLAELKAAKKEAQQANNGSSTNPGKSKTPEQIEADYKKAEADRGETGRNHRGYSVASHQNQDTLRNPASPPAKP